MGKEARTNKIIILEQGAFVVSNKSRLNDEHDMPMKFLYGSTSFDGISRRVIL